MSTDVNFVYVSMEWLHAMRHAYWNKQPAECHLMRSTLGINANTTLACFYSMQPLLIIAYP